MDVFLAACTVVVVLVVAALVRADHRHKRRLVELRRVAERYRVSAPWWRVWNRSPDEWPRRERR